MYKYCQNKNRRNWLIYNIKAPVHELFDHLSYTCIDLNFLPFSGYLDQSTKKYLTGVLNHFNMLNECFCFQYISHNNRKDFSNTLILTEIFGEVFSRQSVVGRKGHIHTDRWVHFDGRVHVSPVPGPRC